MQVQSVLSWLALAGAIAGAGLWLAQTVRHRMHLSQCVQDLQRQRRLDRRLTGCVNDLERLLDQLPSSSGEQIPEELAGHAMYLFGLRQEAADNASHLSRHALRLRWTEGTFARTTLASKRCELAHGALVTAFKTLADAAREYERGLPGALRHSGDGAASRALRAPMRLLDDNAATEVTRLRDECSLATASAADATGIKYFSATVFDATWPVWRSELKVANVDPYDGEIRPMGWHGFGPQPLVNVDAR